MFYGKLMDRNVIYWELGADELSFLGMFVNMCGIVKVKLMSHHGKCESKVK